ncbi:TusE/DsrC/DsvC family sulfur relay protein [Oceanospirillaceae bacterium]|jgi:tRNA 2-thiouridine synthesizing protein E|nr:TusE/DsrC/DsvC family sulfur relay protein [Oceanospirillaceae bacterium]MDB9958388.1 TusE/DsrC/DsvC family sulfur relay protein [Oceanospirillaceae bacterium]MDB9972884.1 TusE/DsrC/DsvC family sulfur relay protein [Oceanospirillaceae bacterium]MDC1509255.1 TusE/DsrC/DsvC family sulfur relay protein [Oceanospirillaceae bacterium]|tara:strand:+ start:661 stop:972 length:312 start_codon:yes stop_codon:yes gene_type:complete
MHLQTDKDGYLKNLNDWNPEVAKWLASSVDVTLETEHWEVINALRVFYADTGVSPAMRILVKIVKKNISEDKGNSIHLLTLFPGSPAKLAAKIAGLPRPTNCL